MEYTCILDPSRCRPGWADDEDKHRKPANGAGTPRGIFDRVCGNVARDGRAASFDIAEPLMVLAILDAGFSLYTCPLSGWIEV